MEAAKEKGHQGTCIKDTWTKQRGQDRGWEVGMGGVWGEWWGENRDNCC